MVATVFRLYFGPRTPPRGYNRPLIPNLKSDPRHQACDCVNWPVVVASNQSEKRAKTTHCSAEQVHFLPPFSNQRVRARVCSPIEWLMSLRLSVVCPINFASSLRKNYAWCLNSVTANVLVGLSWVGHQSAKAKYSPLFEIRLSPMLIFANSQKRRFYGPCCIFLFFTGLKNGNIAIWGPRKRANYSL